MIKMTALETIVEGARKLAVAGTAMVALSGCWFSASTSIAPCTTPRPAPVVVVEPPQPVPQEVVVIPEPTDAVIIGPHQRHPTPNAYRPRAGHYHGVPPRPRSVHRPGQRSDTHTHPQLRTHPRSRTECHTYGLPSGQRVTMCNGVYR